MIKKAYLRGLKPQICCWVERPKAKGLGYLEATASATAKTKANATAKYRDLSTALHTIRLCAASVEMTCFWIG